MNPRPTGGEIDGRRRKGRIKMASDHLRPRGKKISALVGRVLKEGEAKPFLTRARQTKRGEATNDATLQRGELIESI